MYDVVIAGAGPAGCITAKLLADSGYSVLIADKTAMPRQKSCSGILIQKFVGILEHTFGKIPQAVYAEPHLNKGVILTTDTGMKVPVEGLCLSIWRSLLDYWMALEAADADAVFLEETPVTGFSEKKDHVAVRLGGKSASRLSARVLAGCDGPAGTIRRKLRKKPGDCITTYQVYSKGKLISILHTSTRFCSRNFPIMMHGAWSKMTTSSPVSGFTMHRTHADIIKNFSRTSQKITMHDFSLRSLQSGGSSPA